MHSTSKYLLYIAWLTILYIGGILLFTRGFLLTRFVITEISDPGAAGPSELPRLQYDSIEHGQKYKKAVFVIIDALRFDFLAYNNSLLPEKELPYQNKLLTIEHLLKTDPSKCRLYHFIADPPTTTLQRLKGLTTGSLPTFIDVASNFDSSAISEDNIIDQFVANNRSIVFMGDDTWTSIFPTQFTRAFPYPSFNTRDLHTVDNGVLEHLQPELAKNDWDFLIAHFLGVDHCGHRYGPNHPAMAEKLTQMDKVLKTVIEGLDDDSILFVLGDHGMTRTGDHGGDSWDELNAGLFVYSPKSITASQNQATFDEFSQIDLVPTISLLLGTPVPFSSLGTIIPDLFNESSSAESGWASLEQELSMISALRTNARQVEKYIAFNVPWSSIMMYGMLASEHFFSLGHQTNITTIQWQSAFHGFHGDFDYYIIPAILVGTNTFASYLVCVLTLPLLVFWPLTRKQTILDKTKTNNSQSKGEFECHENTLAFRRGLARLFVGYMLFQGLKVFAVMCCDLLLRRHLMVWKIFAPRFLFEAVTFVLVAPLCIVAFLFILRIDSALGHWVNSLQKSD